MCVWRENSLWKTDMSLHTKTYSENNEEGSYGETTDGVVLL